MYDWIRLSNKSAKRRSRKKHVGATANDPEFDESDDELVLRPVKIEQRFEEKTVVCDKLNDPRDFIENDIGCIGGNDNSDDDDGRDKLDIMEELAEEVPKNDHSFKIGHPQSNTHREIGRASCRERVWR